MKLPDMNDENVRAGVISHAIRLGKCPAPGMVLSFAVQVHEVSDLEAAKRGDLTGAKDLTEKIPISFVVTKADIDNAIRLINAQQITYVEPKTSFMPLSTKPQEKE